MTKFYVGEVREVHETGGGDPGWGVTPPVDPGFGGGRPPHISTGPVLPPLPGVWPPLTPDRPAHPLPPDSPWLPGTIWPGSNPDPGWSGGVARPPHIGGGPATPPVRPGHDLPGRPPHISGQPLPPPGGSTLPEGPPPPNTKPEKFVVLCWISGGIGWNYVVVDTSLTPGMPLPETPVAAPKA